MSKKINKKPDPAVIRELYLMWLKGKSLRSLAGYLRSKHGITVNHSSISAWFNQEYGEGATDPVACSLQRSLLTDYEGNPEVEAWVFSQLIAERSEVHHRSNHSINQLTKYQTVTEDGILDYLVPATGSEWERVDQDTVIELEY